MGAGMVLTSLQRKDGLTGREPQGGIGSVFLPGTYGTHETTSGCLYQPLGGRTWPETGLGARGGQGWTELWRGKIRRSCDRPGVI